jgi:periplasmic mercuric ion binding protein
MKTLSIVLSFLFIGLSASFSHAQKTLASSTKKENFKVWGECGMCEKTIEKAALKAGASTASWNQDSKILSVRYASGKTSSSEIQQSIAAAGYDTKAFTASGSAYENLPAYCHYQRKDASGSSATEAIASACCAAGKCTGEQCAGEKCTDMASCAAKTCCKSSSNH